MCIIQTSIKVSKKIRIFKTKYKHIMQIIQVYLFGQLDYQSLIRSACSLYLERGSSTAEAV